MCEVADFRRVGVLAHNGLNLLGQQLPLPGPALVRVAGAAGCVICHAEKVAVKADPDVNQLKGALATLRVAPMYETVGKKLVARYICVSEIISAGIMPYHWHAFQAENCPTAVQGTEARRLKNAAPLP